LVAGAEGLPGAGRGEGGNGLRRRRRSDAPAARGPGRPGKAERAQSLRAPLENLSKQASGAQAQGSGKKTESDFGIFASGTYTTTGAVLCNEVPKTISAADEKRAVDDAWKKYVK
jgi:hypothetical protein